MASIGAAEIVHAAMRGEKFTTIFVNNAIYGMTGGQMAPTTLIGQKATTCQEGRTREQAGMPIRMAEMLSTLDAAPMPSGSASRISPTSTRPRRPSRRHSRSR